MLHQKANLILVSKNFTKFKDKFWVEMDISSFIGIYEARDGS